MSVDPHLRDKPARRARLALILALAGFVAAVPGAARADEPGAVVHEVHSRDHLRAFWTPARIRNAKPLSLVVGPGGRIRTQSGSAPAAAAPTADGTDTGDSTLYPNRANGLVLFFFGPDEFGCSGSVVNSPAGNLVLTAGHCVIDPGPGTHATDIVFIPGYRDGNEPFGEWPATSFTTTPQWESTTSTGNPDDSDEAGDIAILTLAGRPGDGATIQGVVGAVGIAFNQARSQTYMQYGYPAEFPYDGSRLYELTSGLAGSDPTFNPPTLEITSDFTPGSSGGPWLVGNPPVALSVSDYKYVGDNNHMYGPYFGSIAQQLYAAASNRPTSPAAATAPSNHFTIVSIVRKRHRGIAILRVHVPGPGRLVLSGNDIKRVVRIAAGAGTLGLPVRAVGAARRELRSDGSVRLDAKVAYTPAGGATSRKQRGLRLVKRG
jgi:V8-like Glu-specific endopeptidase